MKINFSRTVALAVSTFLSIGSESDAAITSGDLAFIGMRDSTPDEFSIVALHQLNTGDFIYIGDIGVNGSTVAKTGDLFRIEITTSVTPGSVLTLTDSGTGVGTTWLPSITGAGAAAVTLLESGPYSDGGSNANISGSDPFFVFSSTDNAATTANSTNLFLINAHSGTTQYSPSGLSSGDGQIQRGASGEDLRYTGTRSGTASELYDSISNINNWDTFSSTGAGETNFMGGSFTVTPVPEPSSIALLGIGGLALALRRKK